MDVFILGSYVSANTLQVKQLPKSGESIQAKHLWAEHGGKGLNLAVGMHRLGLLTQALFAVGDDVPGHALRDLLHREGMDTQGIIQMAVPSGFGVGVVAADGGNTIVVYPGANAQLSAEHVRTASQRLRECRLVCAQFEIPDSPILEAFQQARQHGIQTLLNPSPWRIFDPAVLALTDILVLNETEAKSCFGIAEDAALTVVGWLERLPTLVWQGKLLVITLAEQGCIAWQAGYPPVYEPAWTIMAQDPTGAGDAFTAGLVRALLDGRDLKNAVRFGNACGAMVAAMQGVLPALPALEQVARFMNDSERYQTVHPIDPAMLTI